MSKQYFRMLTDSNIPERWYLASPININTGEEVDARVFTAGKFVQGNHSYIIPQRRLGKILDITYADFHLPILTKSIANLFETMAPTDVQIIPIMVEGSDQEFRILNITKLLDCLDTELSQIQWWTVDDGRPDRIGMPRMITRLVIDPEKVTGSEVFRLANWEIAVIVSEKLKSNLENMKVLGVKFEVV